MMRLVLLLALILSVFAAPPALAKGSPGAPSVAITGPTSFGSVVPNQTARITLTMTSTAYVGVPTVTAGGPFSLVSTTCTGNVKSCTATIAFTPVLGGNYTAQFTASVVNYYHRSITLSGHGYGPSYAWVSPLRVYGVPTGTRGSAQMVLDSTGDTGLTVSGFSLGAGGPLTLGPTTCLGRLIAPGTSCTVDIDYNFDEVDPGSWIDGTISATTNSGATGYGAFYIQVGGSSD